MSQLLSIKQGYKALLDGKIVGVPSETVYGLAGNALDEKVVAKIFAAKKRPSFNPIICHFPNKERVFEYAQASKLDKHLAKLWPAPISLIMRHNRKIPKITCAGLNTVAFRVPQNQIFLELLAHCPFPLAAPSANLSGKRSSTSPNMVLEDFGSEIAGVIDGGFTSKGIESTVVRSLNSKKLTILRHGSFPKEKLIELGFAVEDSQENTEKNDYLSPGMLEKHYAPQLPLFFIKNREINDDFLASSFFQTLLKKYKVTTQALCFLTFGKIKIRKENFALLLNLSSKADLVEAGKNLFAYLDIADKNKDTKLILSHALPEKELGVAINDRLRRASSYIID